MIEKRLGGMNVARPAPVSRSTRMGFEQLDFLYMPSVDVAGDAAHYVDCLGAALVFAIEAFGSRVAMVRLAPGPDVLFADHLTGERPILVYRVTDLDAAAAE